MSRSQLARRPALGLPDAVSLVVGIIVGSGIFMTPPGVFANVPDPLSGLAVWLAGGAVAAVGALVYAELATAYPSPAGEYVYLRRAYGRVGVRFSGWGFSANDKLVPADRPRKDFRALREKAEELRES